MQMYKSLQRILTAVLLPLQHLENSSLQQIEPFAPPTGDINFGIIAAIVCIALFMMYITLRGKRRK